MLNVDRWLMNPFEIRQLVSWLFLIISLVLIIAGVADFQTHGKIDKQREDGGLVVIEKTNALVTTGIYRLDNR